jgi:hypothetical protein
MRTPTRVTARPYWRAVSRSTARLPLGKPRVDRQSTGPRQPAAVLPVPFEEAHMLRRRLGRALAAALTVTAVAAPAARARPIELMSPPTPTPQSPPVIRTVENEFDWGSAAIGAGAGAAIVLFSMGGVHIARVRPAR